VETQKPLRGHQFPLCDQWESKAEEGQGTLKAKWWIVKVAGLITATGHVLLHLDTQV
jgi:hypothetical protein